MIHTLFGNLLADNFINSWTGIGSNLIDLKSSNTIEEGKRNAYSIF